MLVVNHNPIDPTWIEINQLQPTDVTFWTLWKKPMLPERSDRVDDADKKHKY